MLDKLVKKYVFLCICLRKIKKLSYAWGPNDIINLKFSFFFELRKAYHGKINAANIYGTKYVRLENISNRDLYETTNLSILLLIKDLSVRSIEKQ